MSLKKLATGWLATWLVLGVLITGAFVVALRWHPILQAAGVEVSGAPSTVDPSLLAPSPVASSTARAGVPASSAATPSEGPLPSGEALQKRLASLDVSGLTADKAYPVTTAFAVVDLSSGKNLAGSNATTALIPASTTKLLTVTALLHAMTGDETFPTAVVSPAAGSIVLVGGGDPLLTSEPAEAGAYPQPASLRLLATRTAEALKNAGDTTVTLGYDASLFTDGWNQTWPAGYHDQVTTISALWADEGRDVSHVRSADPSLLAATTFAAQLTELGITVTGAPAVADGEGGEVARVESLPLHVLAEQAMVRSNNSYTEVLGRQLALATGQAATFAGATAAIQSELTDLHLWDAGAALSDASGLSRSNRVTAGMLARAVAHDSTDDRMSVILDGFPVAGVTGTLADRFDDPVAAPARGVAKAKTGTLSLVSTLAGVTTTADGRPVAYAFMTNGSPNGWAAKVWADRGVGTITSCGCS